MGGSGQQAGGGGTGERAARVREGRVRGGRRAAPEALCRRRAVLGEEGVEGGASRSGTAPRVEALASAGKTRWRNSRKSGGRSYGTNSFVPLGIL